VPYHIEERQLEADERERLLQGYRRSADTWVWILLPLAVGAGAGLLAAAILGWIGVDTANLKLILVTGGVILGIYPTWREHRSFAADASAIRKAVADGIVEMIHVKSSDCVKQEPFNSEGPIYYFDIAPNQILFMWGQWIYYAQDPNGTAADPSYAEFPTNEFTVHRLSGHGMVIKFEVTGEVIEPSRALEWKEIALSNLRECEILDGSFSDLAGAIAARRNKLEHFK